METIKTCFLLFINVFYSEYLTFLNLKKRNLKKFDLHIHILYFTNTIKTVPLISVLVSECLRRIQGGDEVYSEKSYMVYLVKSPESDKPYDEWLCGGALVSALFILTSQACVNDVEHMFAIAGYTKYVPDKDIETDQCTKEKKKKVVYFCVPESVETKNDSVSLRQTKYGLIDIALAKVESAYDLSDISFKILCSYIPTVIPINFEKRFQEPGTDAIVLGWGHIDYWRKPIDKKNYNKKLLRYAPVKITENRICKSHYAKYPVLNETIDKYTICTMEDGGLNEEGEIIISLPSSPLVECEVLRLSVQDNVRCNLFRARNRAVLESKEISNSTPVEIKNRTLSNHTPKPRRPPSSGFCQNDHGGPLVTWVGSKEVLIGVASLFKVSNDSKCIGPYLFTSTQRNSVFIHCVMKKHSSLSPTDTRRSICDRPPNQRGFRMVEKNVSWTDHAETLAVVKYVGDTLNHDTKKTTRTSKAFEDLIKVETFWEKNN